MKFPDEIFVLRIVSKINFNEPVFVSLSVILSVNHNWMITDRQITNIQKEKKYKLKYLKVLFIFVLFFKCTAS